MPPSPVLSPHYTRSTPLCNRHTLLRIVSTNPATCVPIPPILPPTFRSSAPSTGPPPPGLHQLHIPIRIFSNPPHLPIPRCVRPPTDVHTRSLTSIGSRVCNRRGGAPALQNEGRRVDEHGRHMHPHGGGGRKAHHKPEVRCRCAWGSAAARAEIRAGMATERSEVMIKSMNSLSVSSN